MASNKNSRLQQESAEYHLCWMTAAELRERGQICPQRWIWDQMIPAGRLTVFAGPPKAGKSTLLRSLLQAVAGKETKFLGAPLGLLQQGDVADVISEEAAEDWNEAPDGVKVHFHHGAPIRRRLEWDAFITAIREPTAPLLIIDSISNIWGGNENDSKAVNRAMAGFRSIAREYDTAVIVIHHATKSSSGGPAAVRGSAAWTGCADHVLTLSLGGQDEADPLRDLASVGRKGLPRKLQYTLNVNGQLSLPGDSVSVMKRQSRRGNLPAR